jgi:hypothetical protein
MKNVGRFDALCNFVVFKGAKSDERVIFIGNIER